MIRTKNTKDLGCGAIRAFAVIVCLCLLGLKANGQAIRNGVDYIDTSIGNVAPFLNPNRPVVHLPNQMVRMFPNRKDHLDMQITDFPMLATNVITPQIVFSIKPSIGEVTDTAWYSRLTYDHDFEVMQPWYYSVLLTDDHIITEFTAGEKTGIYRFTFPVGVQKNLLLSHNYANGQYEFGQANDIAGTEFVNDAIHQQHGEAYMYGVFTASSQKGKRSGEKDWGRYTVAGMPEKPKKVDGERAFITYPATSPVQIEFRYAISFISREQAKKNFEELKGVSFEQLQAKGKMTWEKVIGKVIVEGGTQAQRRSFYTSLYRCYPRMVNITESGKYYSGYDKKVHEETRPFYTDDYTWGNYVALHPLRIILDPKREADILQSYVRMYEQSDWMPDYPRHYGDRAGMFGFHSAIMFLDAYRKGVRDFDVNKAFEGMLKSAEQATMLPSRNGPKGALEDFYYEKGYYPALHPGEPETDPLTLEKRGQKRSSVAITLANSYDSWALSELATELGKTDVNKKFAPRARNYRNLWYPKVGMFMPKDAEGKWIDIDPKFDGGKAGLDYYNENNGWSYWFHVQHDVRGLSELMGGPDKLEANLDRLFREGTDRPKHDFWARFPDQTGLIGMFSMGNQVTFFIPYLFNYTNSPWKTQKYTRLILDTYFQDTIFGVPGDEDAGSMSSFVVFSAMGFFPVKPGSPSYTITSPLFSKVTIDLDNGKKFTILAPNVSRRNKYIQSAKLNGKELTSLSFTHSDLINGGTLVLEMGEGTEKKWTIQY